ncbi:MAG: oligosaccharide flippase family protein [Candidatus Latescibacterota bacterium]|nr:MAG: oligosaccharide flippase family protein [Candidatus Latescibacterota bacterium]
MNARKASWSFLDTSLERSFLWTLAITALPVASGFVVSWVVARFGGVTVIGTVSWVMSFATMLLILGKFGLDLATSRLASEFGVAEPGKLRALFAVGLRLRLMFTLTVAAATFAFAGWLARFFNEPLLAGPIRVGAIVVVCASLYEFKENLLIGLNRFQTVYKVRSLHLGLRVVFTAVVVFLGAGATAILAGYCGAWVIAIALYAVLLIRFLPSPDSLSDDDTRSLRRRLVRLSVALAVSSASVTIYAHMDRLILGYFSGVNEVGQYAVARNITEVTLFPVFAATMTLRPALAARFSAGDRGECSRIIRKTLRFTLVSGVLFCSIFLVLGVPLVTLVFSDEFRYAGQLMVFFVWVIVMRSLGAVILPALVAAERTRLYAYLTTVSALIYFLMSVFLIPRFDSSGAVVATIVSYGVLLVWGLREVFAVYGVRLGWRPLTLVFRTVLAGAIASGAAWWLIGETPGAPKVLLWAALVSAFYLFLIFVLRVSTFSEIRGLWNNLRQQKE